MTIDVMMVDDRKDTLEIAEKMLTRINHDFRLSMYQSCEEALKNLKDSNPDAIICDYDLGPNCMNGLEMLEKIRATGDRTPFIIFTGRSREDIAVDALNMGADYYLLKELGNAKAVYEQLAHYVSASVEKHRITKRLERSETRFRTLFEQANVGMTIVDSSNNLLEVNESMAKMLGYTTEEMEEMNVSDFSHPEDNAIDKSKYLACLEKGEPSYSLVKRYTDKTGNIVWGRLSCTILPNFKKREDIVICMVEDITERVETRQELERQKEEYEAILNSAPDMVFSVDREGVVLNISNQPHLYSPENIIGRKLWNFIDDDWVETVKQVLKQVFSTGKKQQTIARITRNDGDEIWYEAYLAPNLIDGEVENVTIVARDITKQYEQKKALEKSEANLKAIFEQSAVGMARVALNGVILEPNPKLCEILGYEKEELRGKSAFEITIEEDAEKEKKLSQKLRTGKINNYQMTKRFIRKNADVIVGRLSVSLVRKPDGTPDFTIGILEDVTSEIEARSKLRESEERFRAIFEQSNIGMTIVDLDDNIININEAYCKLIGFSRDEILEMKVADYTHPEDIERDSQNLKQVLEGDEISFRMDKRYYRKDGEMVWVDLNVTLIHDSSGKPAYVIGIANDITEQKKAQQALFRSREEFRHVFEKSPIGIEIINSEGKIVHMNPMAREIFGIVDVDQVIGMDLLNDPNTSEEVREAIRKGKELSFEHKFRFDSVKERKLYDTTGSGYRHLETKLEPILMENSNEVEKFVLLINDVTEQVEARNALVEQEQFFRQIFETSPIAIDVFDKDGNVIDANQACLEMFGLESFDELKGFNIFNDPNLPAAILEGLKKGKVMRTTSQFDFDLVRENELYSTDRTGVVHLETVHSPLEIDGEISGYLIQMLDITEQVQATETLKAREEEFRAIFEESPIAIQIFDSEGNLIRANRAAKQLFGFSESIEQSGYNLFTDPNIPEENKKQLKQHKATEYNAEIDLSENPFSSTATIGNEDVAMLDVAITPLMHTVESGESLAFLAQVVDRTEEKLAEKVLKRQREELSEFVHQMSHDVKNYLHRIRGYAELWKMDNDEEYEEKIATVVSSLDKLLDHSVNLADSGLTIDRMEKVDLNTLVDAVADISLPSRIDFKRTDLEHVMGDKTKIRQIFSNLFDNAVKHGDASTVEVRIISRPNSRVIHVINNGEPIDSSIAESLFSDKITHSEQGFGLQIVRRIANAHGWEVRLVNRNPVTFEIIIPAKDVLG